MVYKRKFQRCYKKSSSLFEKKNGLDSIRIVDYRNRNVLCGISKKLRTTVFSTCKSILISEASTSDI